jgi:hypothetical protein
MNNIYVVRTVPVRDERGAVAGWVRVDLVADGSLSSDLVFLRDGSACTQADAVERIAENPALLYRTEDEAVRDGIDRLRAASQAPGATRRMRRRRP